MRQRQMLSLDKKRINLLKGFVIGICFLLTNDKTASKEGQNLKELKLKCVQEYVQSKKGNI
jgi:hypothetical protein